VPHDGPGQCVAQLRPVSKKFGDVVCHPLRTACSSAV
jgi:hypothetical protein